MSTRNLPAVSKLSPDLVRRLVDVLRIGNYFATACRYVGIRPETGRDWMNRGLADGVGVYYEFREKVLQAESLAEVAAVAAISRSFETNPKAAIDFLERRYPKRWGRSDRVEVSHTAGAPAEAAAPESLDMSPEQVELFARQMAQLESVKAPE